MVRGKYVATGSSASARWSVLPRWIPHVLAGAVVLSLFDQFYAVFRLFVPDPSQGSGYPGGAPLSVRIFQWALWADANGSAAMTLLPAALLAWFASSRQSWTPAVSARVKTVALVGTLMFTALTALRPIAAIMWVTIADASQNSYGLPTDDLLAFALSSGVIGSIWTAPLAAVMSWVLYAARPTEPVGVAETAHDGAEALTPDDVFGPGQPTPSNEPPLERLELETEQPHEQPRAPQLQRHDGDPDAVFRRPG